MSGIVSDGRNDSTPSRNRGSGEGVGRRGSDEQFYRFFFVSKSNLKIHRIQLRLIKFQIRDVFDGLRFSSIFPSVNIEKKKKKINK